MNISLKHCLLAFLTLCLSSMSPASAYAITLHPGAHGSIAGANSGTDYVTTVANGAAFPAVTATPATGDGRLLHRLESARPGYGDGRLHRDGGVYAPGNIYC
ncbi:MAG: hypothetical protein WCH43_15080 [Verrucomicrobiota bacterium]